MKEFFEELRMVIRAFKKSVKQLCVGLKWRQLLSCVIHPIVTWHVMTVSLICNKIVKDDGLARMKDLRRFAYHIECLNQFGERTQNEYYATLNFRKVLKATMMSRKIMEANLMKEIDNFVA